MITEKDTIKCEAVFNDEHTHRFWWKRVWCKEKPLAAVIMLNPCEADTLVSDTSTALVTNNIARLEEYGGVIIINLFSILTTKLEFRWNSDEELNQPENDSYIKKAAEDCKTVILAWGRGAAGNQRISNRVEQVLELLKPQEEKLWVITDGIRKGLHPLTPSVRTEWLLEKFVFSQQPKQNNNKAA